MQDDPSTENIALLAQSLTRCLFRTHVFKLALEHAVFRVESANSGLCDTKVRDLDFPVVGHQNIGR